VTLRQALGGDARRVHELVDELLDSEDALLMLIDGERAICYAEGFGLSPCQLELVATAIDRAVRSVGGRAPTQGRGRRMRDSAHQNGCKAGPALAYRRCTRSELT